MRLGAERFHNYLFGNEIINCGKMLPPRIKRLAWRLHQYSYKIKHIPGEVNIADPLSRLPLEELDKTTSSKVLMNMLSSLLNLMYRMPARYRSWR